MSGSAGDDIAIIGMACRVAGADSPSKLWELLASSKDVQSEITRFNVAGFYSSDGGPRKGLTNVRHAYFVDDSIDRFDNAFFSIPPLEALAMDPQQRLLLEIAYEAVESAGIPLEEFQGTDTAVYTGLFTSDYGTSLLRDIDAMPKYQSTGTSNSIAANRLSYFFNLHGPSMVIDTACSSTMVALHQAVLSLKAKDAGMALVCGANLILNPDMFVHMSELGFLSPSGRCQSFDASGDGYARGEGVLALLLKPLDEALRDGDPIRSVIRGTRINQDGRTNGITLPSSEAQKKNMEALYKDYNLFAGDVQYLEAHGTGTAVGDPIEMSAIESVFAESHRTEKLIVGSVKSNVGHLEACAALIGIVKAVQCLERGQIPPQMHFANPNPKINFESMTIPTTMLSWPKRKNGVRTAAVNSFGFGGTNGHVVLDHRPAKPRDFEPLSRPFLFKLSAASDSSLAALVSSYAEYVRVQKPSLSSLAHTLLGCRSTLKKSHFLTASSHTELLGKLEILRHDSSKALIRRSMLTPEIGFIFTGQGAQWPEMGKQLMQTSKLFAAVIDECDRVLTSLNDGPFWKIREELIKPSKVSRINSSSFSQPICTALQLGLVEIWKAWGIKPRAVIGHSSGEIGAAYAAGILSLRDAVIVAYYRGVYMGSDNRKVFSGAKGAMCAVGISEIGCSSLLDLCRGRVALAAVNSPSNCTLSGDADAIKEIVGVCKERGFFCRELRVDMAYHSHHMLPLAPLYEQSLLDAGISALIPATYPGCEMFSSVTQKRVLPQECTPEYWGQNMVSTVRFASALTEAMQCHNLSALVEIGPHPALKGPAMDTLAGLGKTEIEYFGSCFRNRPDLEVMLETVGEFINARLPIASRNVNGFEKIVGMTAYFEFDKVLTDLPKYQWDHSSSHWAETRVSRNQRFRVFPRHQLLGARSNTDSSLNMMWRNLLTLAEVPWLKDMMAIGVNALPESAFILMALEASRQIQILEKIEGALIKLTNIDFFESLLLSALTNDDSTIETQFNLRRLEGIRSTSFVFSATSLQSDGVWKEHFSGTLTFPAKTSIRPTFEGSINHDAELLDYIKSFKTLPPLALDTVRINGDHASGTFTSYPTEDEQYHLASVLFASLTQVPMMLLLGSGFPASYKLGSIDKIEVPLGSWRIRDGDFNADLTRLGPTRSKAELQILDGKGHYISLGGMRFRTSHLIEKEPALKSLFYKPEVLPDITYMKPTTTLPISQVIQLVTHKWPMSDVAIVNLTSDDLGIINSHLQSHEVFARPRFRSLNILGESPTSDLGRVRTMKSFGANQRFHLLFCSAQGLPSYTLHMLQAGLVCVRTQESGDQDLIEDKIEIICQVSGFQNCGWLLGRLKPLQNGGLPTRRLKIFANEGFNPSLLNDFRDFEFTQLEKQATAKTSTGQQQSQDAFDLIVLDCGKASMLAAWAGSDLLPWLQAVLERVGNLLWVSCQTGESPFSNVSGSFIRTIQSEHPSMKAASLLFKDNNDSEFLSKTVFEVYDKMLHGSNEVELVVHGLQVSALRYQPDDELAAAVGITSPYTSSTGLGSNSYEISLAGPSTVVILSERFDSNHLAANGDVYVAVEASVIDHSDAMSFSNSQCTPETWDSLGQFFAGKVLSSGDSSYKPGTLVVGWQIGAHRSKLHVPSSRLHCIPENVSPAEAAARYAASTVAFAIVCETARARPRETLNVQVPGLLAEVVTETCNYLGVIPSTNLIGESDFVITYNSHQGLRVNGKIVSVKNYITSSLPQMHSSANLLEDPCIKSPISVFGLEDLQRAFQNALTEPISTVLVHTSCEQVKRSLVHYKNPTQMFRDDAAYVIIGGLGGLGRYLSTWMVMNGARHLVTLSRSGLASEEARNTVQAIHNLGAEIQVFKVDASDAKAVDQTLTEVRKTRTIRGCLNMVLILDNSPFMTMKPTQWDRVLRTKVDCTWNLHQATLCDDLDMFIMFSSISSISGNRTQANYATGNSFQNSMAEYRRSLGLPGIAIALGAMSGIGVLANDQDLLRTLSQAGLQSLGPHDLTKVMEAAIFESQHTDRTLLSVGFEMFETVDGVVHSRPEQNQLFWTESPEFGFLLDHKFTTIEAAKVVSLREQLHEKDDKAAHEVLVQAFLACINSVLGYDIATLDQASSLTSYGLDSLNAVSCRYWFFKQLEIDVPVFDILGSRSINELVSRVLKKLRNHSKLGEEINIPQPIHYQSKSLQIRPLSHSQSRLWFLQKFLPDKTVYNLLLVCHISGIINVPLFSRAWTVFVQRHEILHSRIIDTADGLQQVPIEHPGFTFIEVEASELTFQSQIEALTQTAKNHVFALEAGELVRGWLLRSPIGMRFFLASHHLAWDRSSVPTIFDETTAIYKALLKGKALESVLSPVPYQFVDYTIWQEQWMDRQELVKPHTDYWKVQLDGIPEAVSLLPTARTATRPTLKQYSVDSVPLKLDSSLTSAIKAFCKTNTVTPFMFVASAMSTIVHRLTGDNDIVVGIADGDRGHTEFDRLVGFTVNMLPIRSRFSKDISYVSLLEEYRKACLEAYEHRAIPFDYLLQQLGVPRRTSHAPIFQITVNYQIQGSFPECDYGDFKFTNYDHYNARSQSDFTLDVEETKDGMLDCTFEYDASLYDRSAILNLTRIFRVFLENVLATEGLAKIDSINLVPADDQSLISSILQPSFKHEPSLKELDSSLFPSLFFNAVLRNPTKTAIIDDTRELNYHELNIATNRVANFLAENGAQTGDRIGVCCEQSIDMIIAMYGIILAGCVYVPIDPDFPEERMLSMIEDVELESVFVDRSADKLKEQLIACGIKSSRIYVIDTIATSSENTQTQKSSRDQGIPDSFCCIFTSGSTGRPKGIYIGHKQLRYQMEGYHNFIATKSEDRILLSSAMVFDMSLPSIYGIILREATMIIASREARYSPAKMVDQLVELQISSCTFTTTQLKMLFTAPNKEKLLEWTSLRSMVIGGEHIPPWVVRDFHNLGLPSACMYNGYAPSETTVCNSLRKLLPEDAKRQEIPLERPLFPTRFHILDENQNPVPIGLGGELYIGGPTVNKGYIKREDITAYAFRRDPFAPLTEINNGNGRLYRTGDSFRLMPDGTIQAMGRIGGDRQVKIRGMRTELNEIENVIYDSCNSVEDPEMSRISLVAVVYHRTGDLEGVLAAYLATTLDDAPMLRSLRLYIQLRLKATLPIHMVPSAFVFLPSLPRMVSGKIDYKAISKWSPPSPELYPVGGTDFGAVQLNDLQSEIASVWKKVLHIDTDLSPIDEFFSLGGHSLILLHVQEGIKEQFHVLVSLGDMFTNPTIAGMEELVVAQLGNAKKPNRRLNSTDDIITNGHTSKEPFLDWEKEGSLPEGFDQYVDTNSFRPASIIAITGACTMAGAHLIHHVLSTTDIKIYCIAAEASNQEKALSAVISTLQKWRLFESITPKAFNRLVVYKGSLSHPTLGLTEEQISVLDREVDAIYQLDSEVSLLKRYDSLRASNVGSLQFLISLAFGNVNNIKAIHYLSTWGVPHLQAWTKTELSSAEWLTTEVEMTNMKPGADGTLGYLKARWACEALLYQAARRGLPVTIYRSCMCGGSPGSGVSLARTDINRRILEGSLQIGLVPDFSSARGGGMSWITADFLVESMLFLSQRPAPPTGQAKIYHLVSDKHVPYTDLAALLETSHAGEKMRTVRPEEWFEALRARGDAEMTMQAEVLEKWCKAGWVPFGLQARETLELLKVEKGIVPPVVGREMLLRLVVGDAGF